VSPDADEVCNLDEPRDDDCDGLIDMDDPSLDPESFLIWYVDDDGDGFGVPGLEREGCSAPIAGTVSNADDCDDTDPTVGGASLWWADDDGDGFGAGDPFSDEPTCEAPAPDLVSGALGEDCEPDLPLISPGAEEVCGDGVDQDCDGSDALCSRLIAAESGLGTGLWDIDVDAGTATALFDPGIGLTGLAFGDDGTLYGIAGVSSAAPGEVYRIDLEAESLESIASTGMRESTLAFADGVLHASDQFDSYAIIDPVSGTIIPLPGSPGGDDYGYANAFDGDVMWRMNRVDLRVVDEDGNDTVVASVSGVAAGRTPTGGGLTFYQGTLMSMSHNRGTSTLYEVDAISGSAVSTGIEIGGANVDALAGFE
jgi:hypothetical protein